MSRTLRNLRRRVRVVSTQLGHAIHRGTMATGPLVGDLQGRSGGSTSPITLACNLIVTVVLGARRHETFGRRVRGAVIATLHVLENMNGVSVVEAIAVLATLAFAAEFLLAAFGIVVEVP